MEELVLVIVIGHFGAAKPECTAVTLTASMRPRARPFISQFFAILCDLGGFEKPRDGSTSTMIKSAMVDQGQTHEPDEPPDPASTQKPARSGFVSSKVACGSAAKTDFAYVTLAEIDR